MPSVLGIVGSARRNGNSEMIVRVALEGAADSGAETEIMRLTDFEIKPCNGCMACLIKNQDCHHKDDAEFVFKKLLAADGVIFATPIYYLSPAGTAKMLVDRMFMWERMAPNRKEKPAAIITSLTDGRGWIGFSVPQVATYWLCAGFRITDALVAPAQGPGEILLKPDVLERAREIGRNLLNSKRTYPVEDTHCPICFGEAFELRGGNRVECPICWVRGEIVGQRGEKALIRFDDDWQSNIRFTSGLIDEHMNVTVKGSGDTFLAKRDAIREARAAFKDKPVNWVKRPE